MLAGCTSAAPDDPPEPVRLPDPEVALDDADRAACERLVAALPERLAGQPRGETTADAATWGDPPIELLCGVAAPTGFDPTAVPADGSSPCTVVSRVGWWIPPDQLDGEGDAVLTAVTFSPRVAVLVPRTYLPEGSAAALAELAAPVRDTLTRSLRCG